ncbi:peptidoglycan recognition protein family protein [Actinomadura alba]|uniref:N-acetylmuramoyl-L-alanine amidase n=1 Tax=Actinomadura alba TaxID=406431 RepID=A0ABR7LIB5_9ACTN|nr:peptidoglycan recognition family protein [Actinomadura alba]MBC6464247.1 N-acetylmuramoyl-L-alanine amidase [Actinomadura alba]
MKLEKRSVFGWPASGAGSASPRNGIAVHYDGSNQGLAKKSHAACREYWARTRKFHMGPSRGWADVGYSWAVCCHGIVLEGRGLNKVQAAQPGGNATWYSVTFMSGPSESPTAAQINAFRELRAWLRGKGVKAAIRPHSAFISTSCCGNILRKLISNGTLAAAPPKPTEELDMTPEQVFNAVWNRDAVPAPPGGPSGPNWKGASFLTNTYRDMAKASEVKALRTEVAGLKSELAEIKALLSAALPPKE